MVLPARPCSSSWRPLSCFSSLSSRMKRQTLFLLLLYIALAVALFFLFSELLRTDTPAYAYEIAAAFMGALVFASTDLLKKSGQFACQFSVVAADRKVTDEERTDLLTTLGELSAIIRHDLASGEGRRTERKLFGEEDLKNLAMANVNSLFGKTTPKHFLDSCSTEARDHFSRLFARLGSEDLP